MTLTLALTKTLLGLGQHESLCQVWSWSAQSFGRPLATYRHTNRQTDITPFIIIIMLHVDTCLIRGWFVRWRKARDNYDKKLLEESETVHDTVESRQRRHLATGVDNATTRTTTTTSASNNQQYISSVSAAGLGQAANRRRYASTVVVGLVVVLLLLWWWCGGYVFANN